MLFRHITVRGLVLAAEKVKVILNIFSNKYGSPGGLSIIAWNSDKGRTSQPWDPDMSILG